MAKLRGAHVTITASRRAEALARDLGADAVIDYESEKLTDHPRDFDAALDMIGGATLRAVLGLVKRGGTVDSIAGTPEPQTALKDLGGRRGLAALFWIISLPLRAAARRAGVRYRFMFAHADGGDMAEIAADLDAGRLRVVLDSSFPFAQIAEAMARLETGRAKGKVVVTMDAP